MGDLDDLEQLYVSKGDAVTDAVSLPSDFRDMLATLQSDPVRRIADRKSRIDNARRLIDQLDSADNNVVKMQKRRVIRAELNAVREIDALEQHK